MDLKILSEDKPSKFEFINNWVIKFRRADRYMIAGLLLSWPRGITFLFLLVLALFSIDNSANTSQTIFWAKFGIAFVAMLNWVVDAYYLKKKWLLLSRRKTML